MCIKPTSGCRGQGAANAQDAAGHGFHEYAVSLHPLKGKLALALCTHTADCIHGHVVTGSLPVIHFLATARLIMCVCTEVLGSHLPARARALPDSPSMSTSTTTAHLLKWTHSPDRPDEWVCLSVETAQITFRRRTWLLGLMRCPSQVDSPDWSELKT